MIYYFSFQIKNQKLKLKLIIDFKNKMQRISREKKLILTSQKVNYISAKNKMIPNGKLYDEIDKKFIDNDIKRENKFLSLKERQKIIRELNQNQNEFDLYKIPSKNSKMSRNNSNIENLLYVKKSKKFIERSYEKNEKKRNNKQINGINKLNLKQNKILVHKTINNYIKQRIKSPLNNKFQFYNLYENNKNNEKSDKKPEKNEIYQKPLYLNNKNNKKISVNLNKDYIQNNYKIKNKINNSSINSGQSQHINFCKKIKSNNGSKKTVFNLINNYNTQTITNKDRIYNSNTINTKSTSNIRINTNYNQLTNNLKEYYNRNYIYKNKTKENKSLSNNKYFKYKKNLCLNEEIININDNILSRKNNYYYNTNTNINNYNFNNQLSNINNDNINTIYFNYHMDKVKLKNSRSFPKKPIYDTNLISDDLINKLVEKDLISFTYNIDKFNNKSTPPKQYKNKEKENINENKFYINTDISRNERKKLILSLSPNSKELKRSKTISFISNKDEEEIDKNTKKEKSRNNFRNLNIRNKSHQNLKIKLITKEVVFPSKINRSISFYNSDDDNMNHNNSNSNSNNNLFINNNDIDNLALINNRSLDDKNQIQNEYKLENYKKREESKNYYFQYLSKKINNDILDEDKINKLGKDLYNQEFFNKKKYCDKCNRNYCPYCSSSRLTRNESENFKNVQNRIFGNSLIHNKSISNNLNSSKYNIENNLIKKQLISSKTDLKLDISNGMHNSQNNIQNININTFEEGSSSSNKFDIIETEVNKDIKNNIYSEQRIKNEGIDDKDIFQLIPSKKYDNTDKLKLASEIDLDNKKYNSDNHNLKNNIISDYSNKINNNNETKNNIIINEFILDKEKENLPQRIEKSDKMKIVKEINIKDPPIKSKYINKELSSKSPILLNILEYINIISPDNYFLVKNNILNLILNNDNNISNEFVNMLYPISINQEKFQPLYAKLFKDLDKFINKKDKNKSIIRTQLMKFCKSNFKKIKNCLENIKYISSDINFIGELITAQMVSKKVGLQCLAHLINKFQRYNSEKNLINRTYEKYLYLDNIINLLNKFATCIFYYQKEKIREDELELFTEEISKNMKLLTEILKNKKNRDMPSKTKLNLIKLIKKSESYWELTYIEQYKYNILKSIYENSNDFHDSNIINNNIDINNNINNKQSIYFEIFENNIINYIEYMKKYGDSNNFNKWEEIDNLFIDENIQKSEIFKSLIESTKKFYIEKGEISYIDIYLKIILEYYSGYFSTNDIKEIIDFVFTEISEISKDENEDINKFWSIIMYYLLENKIIKMNDFNSFCKGYNNEIKYNIFMILKNAFNFDSNKKKIYLKELKNTKFGNINKTLMMNVFKTNN